MTSFSASRTALILIDLQKGIVSHQLAPTRAGRLSNVQRPLPHASAPPVRRSFWSMSPLPPILPTPCIPPSICRSHRPRWLCA
ncbi:hypothetical protein RAA17_25545 [Komagataeibacter rhaeticus]|nr:hypothetical protein [Komagataeibacter rhaeticus]